VSQPADTHLFLADRKQSATQGYKRFHLVFCFEDKAMVRVSRMRFPRQGRVPKNRQYLLTIFQTS